MSWNDNPQLFFAANDQEVTRQETITVMHWNANPPFYFGCGPDGRAGHYVYVSKFAGGNRRDPLVAFLESRDGRLPIQDEGQEEGRAVLQHVVHVMPTTDGDFEWPLTLLAFWDRSVDSRKNSNSVFLLDSHLTPSEALRDAGVAFPWAFQRIRFKIEVARLILHARGVNRRKRGN